MTFQECLVECIEQDELVREFNRLSGTSLSFRDERKPIERMIDDATGYPYPFKNDPDEIHQFISFVFEFVWVPLVMGLEL